VEGQKIPRSTSLHCWPGRQSAARQSYGSIVDYVRSTDSSANKRTQGGNALCGRGALVRWSCRNASSVRTWR
jgi:hypothetical protein